MKRRITRNIFRTRRQERGAALLILLTIIVLAASYTLLKRVNAEKPDITRAADTAVILGQAKAALIGYALKSNVRPGELPCPDYDLDGQSDACQENGSYVTVGRLPWVTLGTADLRDASGESLWYAPALEFDSTLPINSETTAGLRIDGGATEIAAVVIAPGPPTTTQVRPQNPVAQITPARYLEDANRIADVNFASVPGNPGIEFNDQLVSVTRDELMQSVERRVLRELDAALLAFGSYPNPAVHPATTCNSSGINQGLLPTTPDATCPTLPAHPGWFTSNNWNLVVWYERDPGSSLSLIDGASTTNGIQVLLIAGGPPIAGQPDPRLVYNEATLLEGENADGDTVFEVLPISGSHNDQIQVVAP